MPPIAGRHLKMLECFLFCRLAGLVARPKTFVLMTVVQRVGPCLLTVSLSASLRVHIPVTPRIMSKPRPAKAQEPCVMWAKFVFLLIFLQYMGAYSPILLDYVMQSKNYLCMNCYQHRSFIDVFYR